MALLISFVTIPSQTIIITLLKQFIMKIKPPRFTVLLIRKSSYMVGCHQVFLKNEKKVFKITPLSRVQNILNIVYSVLLRVD